MNTQIERRWLVLLLCGYLLITLAYSVVNPLFEAPDEHKHFFTAVYIAETGELPIVSDDPDELIKQEAAQPPLYYWLNSWLLRPFIPNSFTLDSAREEVWFNPFVQLGDASSPTNHNHFVHGSAEAFPWHSWVLAAHLVRFTSLLFGLATLLGIYASAKTLWSQHPERALLAVGLVAFLPQFNFLHSYINNDVAVICFATLTIYQLLRLWFTPQPSTPQYLLLALTIAVAILSKTAGILLLVFAIGYLVIWAWQHKQWASAARGLALIVAIVSLCTAWLFVRNWQLYGDITAANQFVRIAGGDRQASWLKIVRETPGIFWSMFGVFGWFNVRAPEWVYAFWSGLTSISVIGATIQGVRHWRSSALQARDWLPLLMLGWAVAVYAGLVSFMLRTTAAQGRLMFPALVVMALGVSYGLSLLPRRFFWIWFLPAIASTLVIVAWVIPQQYAYPQSVAALPDGVVRFESLLSAEIELVGAEILTGRHRPSDTVWLDLYWRSPAPPSSPPTETPEIVVELFGRENTPIGKLQSFHGGGQYPAQLWQPNEIVHSRIGVRLHDEIVTPTQAKITVRLVDGAAVDVGFVKVGSSEFVMVDSQPLAQFGDGINLISAEIDQPTIQAGATLNVSVRWHVAAAPPPQLTTLIHVSEAGEPPIAQGDSVPLQGDYPTQWWETGETFEDQYVVPISADMPPGTYPIRIGLYSPDFTRLQIQPPAADQTYVIGEFTVVEHP